MDDDDEREFSKTLVFEFFEQAEQTFQDMDEAMYELLKSSSSGCPPRIQPTSLTNIGLGNIANKAPMICRNYHPWDIF